MKLEKISFQVHSMIQAKKPLDCVLALIDSCREAFSSLKRCTVFFVDDAYQLFVTKGNKQNKHNFKSVPCHGVPSGSITGVFRAEE